MAELLRGAREQGRRVWARPDDDDDHTPATNFAHGGSTGELILVFKKKTHSVLYQQSYNHSHSNQTPHSFLSLLHTSSKCSNRPLLDTMAECIESERRLDSFPTVATIKAMRRTLELVATQSAPRLLLVSTRLIDRRPPH